jgi:hypothetical protein
MSYEHVGVIRDVDGNFVVANSQVQHMYVEFQRLGH